MRRKKYKKRYFPVQTFFWLIFLIAVLIFLSFFPVNYSLIQTFFPDTTVVSAKKYAEETNTTHYVYYNPSNNSSEIYIESSTPANTKLDLKEDALVKRDTELTPQDMWFISHYWWSQYNVSQRRASKKEKEVEENITYWVATPDGLLYPTSNNK